MNYLVAVNRKFGDNPSGSARVAWDIACFARDDGHRVVLLCHSPELDDGISLSNVEDGVTVVRFGLPKRSFLQRRQNRIAVRRAINLHLAEFTPDVVHLHSLFVGDAVISALGSGLRYIATVHSPVVPETRLNWQSQGWRGKIKLAVGGLYWLRFLQNKMLSRCERVHVLSEYTKFEIAKYASRLPPVYVVPHWRRSDSRRTETKVEARRQLGIPLNVPVLFSLRRMVPRMGHAVAIRAIAPLLETYGARLVLAGDGPLRASLRSLAASLPGGDRIDFLGRISDSDMRLWYSAADVFILPTMALECFGLIIQESLSFGLPLIASRVGAIPEVLAPLMNDFLVEPGDVEALRHRVDSFLGGSLVPPSSSDCVQYMDSNFDLSVVGPRIKDLIECGRQVENG